MNRLTFAITLAIGAGAVFAAGAAGFTLMVDGDSGDAVYDSADYLEQVFAASLMKGMIGAACMFVAGLFMPMRG